MLKKDMNFYATVVIRIEVNGIVKKDTLLYNWKKIIKMAIKGTSFNFRRRKSYGATSVEDLTKEPQCWSSNGCLLF